MIATVDLNDQAMRLGNLVLAILQPALVLLFIAGIVLASAHLLTMIGTRWGDRRASSKALFFSIAVHLVLACGLIALIPEYRQRLFDQVVNLDDEPIRVTTRLADDTLAENQDATGSTHIWDQPLKVETPDMERFQSPDLVASADMPLPQPVEVPEVEQQPVADRADLPPETKPLPDQLVRADRSELREANAEMELKTLKPETRPEKSMQAPGLERSSRPLVGALDSEVVPRPTTGGVDALLPEVSRDPQASSITDLEIPDAPLQSMSVTPEPTRRQGPAPGTPDQELLGQAERARRSPTMNQGSTSPSVGRLKQRTAISPENTTSIGRYKPEFGPSEAEMVLPQPSFDRPVLPSFDAQRPQVDRPDVLIARANPGRVPTAYLLRTEENRKKALLKYGGTERSEAAVDLSLKWLARMQHPDGYWDASQSGAGRVGVDDEGINRYFAGREADTGITALAVLAFMGKENTLDKGDYNGEVTRALHWLVDQQRTMNWESWDSYGSNDGYLGGEASQYAGMYCHAIATFALGEAYAMSRDNVDAQWLREPLEKAVKFIVETQMPDGGWRYVKGQPYGDLSIFGWQVMALKSAETAGIPVPQLTKQRLMKFLRERALGDSGGLAGYRYYKSSLASGRDVIDPPTSAMTAEALFCRQMLGMATNSAATEEATKYLLDRKPGRNNVNLYYWYYGTLAMYQHGGDEWEQWNAATRDLIISEQELSGPDAGSWAPRGVWGGYGGRVYSTALSTLCLEIYYRYLPIYRTNLN